MNWTQEEVRMADLGDKRLNVRLGLILEELGQKPQLSIPAACGGWAETLGVYRFFDNPEATFANVLASHCAATKERMAACPVVLLAQVTNACAWAPRDWVHSKRPKSMHAGYTRRLPSR